MCLIISADLDRYSSIWYDLNNITLLGTDNYPNPTTSIYDVLCCYKKPAPQRQLHTPPATVTFIQSGDTEKNKTLSENDGRSFPKVTCYRCQETGHYAGNIPASTPNTCTGTQSNKSGPHHDQNRKGGTNK